MSVTKKKENNTKYIILFVITLIIMLACIILVVMIINPKSSKQDTSIKIEQKQIEQDETEEFSEEDEIKTLSETNRIKRYIGIFFANIEDGNYLEAYNVLNQDFKNTYFPKLEDFQSYAEKYFNSSMGVTYENIERLGNNKTGNMYVVWVVIENLLAIKKDYEENKNMDRTNFVIIENGYNDYELSFSVMSEE